MSSLQSSVWVFGEVISWTLFLIISIRLLWSSWLLYLLVLHYTRYLESSPSFEFRKESYLSYTSNRNSLVSLFWSCIDSAGIHSSEHPLDFSVFSDSKLGNRWLKSNCFEGSRSNACCSACRSCFEALNHNFLFCFCYHFWGWREYKIYPQYNHYLFAIFNLWNHSLIA